VCCGYGVVWSMLIIVVTSRLKSSLIPITDANPVCRHAESRDNISQFAAESSYLRQVKIDTCCPLRTRSILMKARIESQLSIQFGWEGM
jgi:hypothetical protein